ncbi:MAG: nucleotidyltransferase domain-containing protein [Fibrobacterota bacterium]
MERIDSETIALYAGLRERLEISENMRSVASLPGDFVTKTVKNIFYHYFQATLPGGRMQIYLGPDSDEIRKLIDVRLRGKENAAVDIALFQRLGAQIMAGNVGPVIPDMARIISRLSDCAVFQAGGVLVGSMAFQILETHLGVRFDKKITATRDIDFSGNNHVALAVPHAKADIPSAIESLQMGFFPVPRLSNKEPSTSYAVRGKTLRIDLLTSQIKTHDKPVFISRFNAAAQPLKFLDYCIENSINAVLICGTPFLVRVPQPARFALHKLIVSQERSASAADKKLNDIAQARLLLEVLHEDRPGDIESAKNALEQRGTGWKKKLQTACKEAGVEL